LEPGRWFALLRYYFVSLLKLKTIMKKVFIFAMAFLAMSCTSQFDEVEENQEKQVAFSEDYQTMYLFVEDIISSELWENLTMPLNPTLEDLMQIAEEAMQTDIFGDTIGEGDCEKPYKAMLSYYLANKPDDEFTEYLMFLVEHEMY
jgi:hypothetical protein